MDFQSPAITRELERDDAGQDDGPLWLAGWAALMAMAPIVFDDLIVGMRAAILTSANSPASVARSIAMHHFIMECRLWRGY